MKRTGYSFAAFAAVVLAAAVIIMSGCGGGGGDSGGGGSTVPSAPTGVTATAADSQVSISWSAASGATSYNIYWSATAGVTTSNGMKVPGAASGQAITGLTNGTVYYFIVTSVNSAGESAASSQVSATPTTSTSVPNSPLGVNAIAGNGQVELGWNLLSGAISYNIYYGTSSGVTTATGTKVTGATSGGAISGLANGTTYYFIVTAANSVGESAASSEVSATPLAPPSAPSGVSALSGNSSVTINWTTVASTTYNIYWSSTSGVTITNGTKVSGATPGQSISSLTNGTPYYFIVTAVVSGVESAASSEVSATPQVPLPGAPTGVGAVAGNAQVSVSWTGIGGATSYNLYYSTSSNVTTTTYTTKVTNATSGQAITSLTNGTTYYFIVTAVDVSGESPASSTASATPRLPGPTGVAVAGVGNARVALSWTTVSGATSYNIYFGTSSGVTIANGTKDAGKTSGDSVYGLTNGTTYYFIVTAVVSGVESAASTEVSGMPFLPSAPTGVIANAGNEKVAVSWTAVSGATGYNLIYGTTSPVTTVNGTKVTGAVSGDVISGLTNSTPYYFVVTALNLGGESTASGEVSATPTNFIGGAIQTALTLAKTVSTFDGIATKIGSSDGKGTTTGTALFNLPEDLATDGTNYYVSDTGNHTIRKVVIATGAVTTLAGSAGVSGATDATGTAALFNAPQGLTINNGNLYVADTNNGKIRKVVISTGEVTTLAAGFYAPLCATTVGTNLYVATASYVIEKVALSDGATTRVAGTYNSPGFADNPIGTSAQFYHPHGITTDGTNLYLADRYNDAIRQVSLTAPYAVTTLAGTGLHGLLVDSPTGTSAVFNEPQGITVSGGNLYVTDSNNNAIRIVSLIAPYAVTTLAGGTYGSIDGTGTTAKFSSPHGITTDDTYLYVADTNNDTIRRIMISSAVVKTHVGSPQIPGSADGTGTVALLNRPNGVTTDGTNLYVADTNNHTIRKVVIATNDVTTLAGTAGVSGTTDATGTAALFNSPQGITTDGTNLYVADTGNHTIRKIVISSGVVTTLAGTAGVSGTTDATGTAALFNTPYGVTTNGIYLYVADTGNRTIRKIVISSGVVTTFAGTAGITGTTDGTGAAARFNVSKGITTDGLNLYVADTSSGNIRQVVLSSGVVTTLATNFQAPAGITTDGTYLYVVDSTYHLISTIVISSGAGTTLAGTVTVSGTTDATGTSAQFNTPRGITTDGTYLYVADTFNNTIRKIQ